jgi:hypothetical protein
MSQSTTYRTVIAIGLLSACALTLAVAGHKNHKVAETTFISANGVRLRSLFTDLKPNSLYSLRYIRLIRERQSRCSSNETKQGNFISRLFAITKVYAACGQFQCTGSYWVDREVACSDYGCSGGTSQDTIFDPDNSTPCSGFSSTLCSACSSNCPNPPCVSCF